MKIKFRGMRVDNGEWVYGSLVQLNSGLCYIIANIHGLHLPLDRKLMCEFTDQVIPETVGQYVCNDKNGNEVYRGSRVKRVPYKGDPDPKPYQTEGRTGTVAWHHGFLRWCFLDDQTGHLDDLVDSEVFEMGLELILDNET